MTTSERVAYLKGLCEGMKLDTEKNEGKLITAIIDVLEDMANNIDDITETLLEISEELDEICDDIEALEDDVYDDDDDDCDCGCCGHGDDDDDEPMFFDVLCPKCKNEISIDEDTLDLGELECPNCGEKLEFDFRFEYDDDDDDEDDE